jgi:hypothetical protein
MLPTIQRVLNDFQRARPSRARMIWLHAHPLSPTYTLYSCESPVSQEYLEKRDNLLTGEAGGGRGAESYDRKKACPLYIIQCSQLH